MVSASLVLLAAGLASAFTPPGFQPASQNDLILNFNSTSATNGRDLPRDSTQTQPRIGTRARLAGTSFAIIMVDLDIPTNTPPTTSTLLHWLATGLTQANATTAFTIAANGTTAPAYALSLPASPAAAQPYAGPNPPARIPLSHRYTQVIVNTTGSPNASIAALQRAAATRQGFDVAAVLASANLTGRVVAGNWFTVTNPGPVMNVTSTSSAVASTGLPTGTARPSATPSVVRNAAAEQGVSGGMLGMVVLGAALLGF